MWNPKRNCVVFGIALAQMFGSGSAPLNFTRYPDFCVRVAGLLLAIVCDHCVDDIIYIEAMRTVMSAYWCWRTFADDCGWDVPDAKSPIPSQYFTALGAELDLTGFPVSPMMLRPAKGRAAKILSTLTTALATKKLEPALGGQLFGRMMFQSSQYFGRFGRATLRAFGRRQHECRSNWNPQLDYATKFWIANVENGRPREIPLDLDTVPVVVSYSDGEGSGGVGAAVWFPDGRCLGG